MFVVFVAHLLMSRDLHRLSGGAEGLADARCALGRNTHAAEVAHPFPYSGRPRVCRRGCNGARVGAWAASKDITHVEDPYAGTTADSSWKRPRDKQHRYHS